MSSAKIRAFSKPKDHSLLGRSRVVFLSSLQETLAIGCYKGVLAGAVPVIPDRLSYRGMYLRELRYRSAWNLPATYEQNKPALVAYLRKVVARAANDGFDLEPCRWQLAPFFSGEALHDRVFARL